MWIFNKEIRCAKRSPKWKNIRQQHLSNNPCCTVCGSCTKPEVHHIVPVHINADKELEQDNLITLCDKYCHFIFGHLMNWKSYNQHILSDAESFQNKLLNRPK